MRVEKKHTQSVETEFNVVPKQSDLTMKIEDSAAIEAKAREQRERKEREQAERERREQELRKRIEQEQQQNKIQNQTQDRDFQLDDDDFEAPQKEQSSKSITSAEAVDKWFKNKLGGGEGVDFELD